MSPVGVIVIIAMVLYAIYRQTQRHEIVGSTRFKLALIYAAVGLVVGGFNFPRTGAAAALLAVSLLLSVVIGLVRGKYTRVWRDETDRRVYAKGTALTIGLFLGLVAAKCALGALAYSLDVSDDGGIGEIIVMIAVMIAFQADLMWRRAEPLGARTTTHTDTDNHSTAT